MLGLIEKISSQQVSAQIKIEVIERAVATCLKVNMGCGRKRIPSMFDSGSQVTLICPEFFSDRKSCPIFNHLMGKGREPHQLFQLTSANNGKLPISMYVELDLDFLGIVVPEVGVLITQEPNEVLDQCHKTTLPGVIGWNLMKLVYEMFIEKYGALSWENFDCPTGVSPMLFSQL